MTKKAPPHFLRSLLGQIAITIGVVIGVVTHLVSLDQASPIWVGLCVGCGYGYWLRGYMERHG